jgi:hypothetical protein
MDTLRVVWEGWDGSRWDLLDPRSPTVALSLAGMGLPGFTQQRTKLGSRDGAQYDGTMWDENTVTITVKVGDEYVPPGFLRRRRGAEWRALDSAFRHSFSPEHTGRLIVTSEKGDRWLTLRLDGPIPIPDDRNPGEVGSATYVIGLTADDQPWWIGDPVEDEFGWSTDTGPFLDEAPNPLNPDEVGLYIAGDGDLNTARISNPGDRQAWPKWWASGPADQVHLGVGDAYVVLPFSIAENARVYVDSFDQTITDELGNSLWPLMGFSDPTAFVPIPPGGEAPLYIRLIGASGSARIGVSIVPRYNGPW